ncbi:MAG: 50S ribosomal protein L10 [Saprospiraceae bacterium]|nr:50S ribosomal protein L10 [Saprospiraceae bacterium]
MTRAEKATAIESLKEKFGSSQFFYLTDSSSMSVEQINDLRRKCFENGVEMKVVKNTLAIKAMEEAPEEKGYKSLFESLKGPTAVMFAEAANTPARIIDDFRGAEGERPILKAAYIDAEVYTGDDQLNFLKALKSKEELLGELVALLQSPAKNLVSSLKSGESTVMGLLKALEQREE